MCKQFIFKKFTSNKKNVLKMLCISKTMDKEDGNQQAYAGFHG
jgi:hypothetical protein